jgi:hypothetical protein
MTITIDQERLEGILKLKSGSHPNPDAGLCLLEAAAYIAGEPHSDHPQCVDPILGAYGRRLNDRLGDKDRQKLKPILPRLIGTANDGKSTARTAILRQYFYAEVIPFRWSLSEALQPFADELAGYVADGKWLDVRRTVRRARTEMAARRATAREQLKTAAYADADADAYAYAYAYADAYADAAAAAYADAAAAAYADAAAAAYADAAAAAYGAAGLEHGSAEYNDFRAARYAERLKAYKARLAEHPLPDAVTLFERLIEAA